MSNWLAITWDENRLLFLSARNVGKEIIFEHAASFSLQASPGESGMFRAVSATETKKIIPEIVSMQVLDFVRKHKLTKAETVLVVGRSDVEVRPMSFPAIPIDEIPEIIRFQAGKEFNRYDTNTPLDFFVLPDIDGSPKTTTTSVTSTRTNTTGNKSERTGTVRTKGTATGEADTGPKRRVLASIIRRELLQEVVNLCEKAGLNLRRAVLHPCEAAYLLKQSPNYNPLETYLAVEVDPTEALLTVIYKGLPIFMRSPRLFGERVERMQVAALSNQLISEIKRTLIAVSNEIKGIKVDQVIILGDSERYQQLAVHFLDALSLPVATFDPWKRVKRSVGLGKELPESPELFAPLIGAVLELASGVPSDIDYLNPKKKPQKQSKEQLLMAGGAALVFLLMVIVGLGLWRQQVATKEVKILDARRVLLEKQTKEVDQLSKQLTAIENWQSTSYDWLGEMHWLSQSIPDSQQVYFTSLDMRVQPTGGLAALECKGVVRDIGVISKMINGLRDKQHRANANGTIGTTKSTVPDYPFPFDITVTVSHTEHGIVIEEEAKETASTPESNETVPDESSPTVTGTVAIVEETVPAEPPAPDETPAPAPVTTESVVADVILEDEAEEETGEEPVEMGTGEAQPFIEVEEYDENGGVW